LEQSSFNQGLLSFIAASPTPFHAVATMEQALQQAGYQRLEEGASWSLASSDAKSGRYYVTRNDSSLCAFSLTGKEWTTRGLRMVGTHTDSPCLKVKPQAEIYKNGYLQLGVEVYGGALLNPWFDRDLSLAGRVSFEQSDGTLAHRLIDFKRPLAIIPSLAIHLDREVNNQHSINAQTDLPPILLQCEAKQTTLSTLLKRQLQQQYPDLALADILDFELSFYDTQLPAQIGFEQQFLAAARLDNLLSCYTGLQSLLATDSQPSLLICNDHEEVGSVSASGAQGTLLRSVLERITTADEDISRLLDRSLFISADNAHGVHPNFSNKHDESHGPLLNKGPVIKVNSNQRYATNSITSALFRQCCKRAGVPVQSFVVRSDMGCGSTIGPITASKIGVRSVDVGVPTFAMHSIRELAGSDDGWYLYQALNEFFNTEQL
jgi:aspartyl aminopeptidase